MIRQNGVVGGYVCLTIQEVEYRVYYEEAGQGIPLILGHTAGADGRQYKHLLCDGEVTKNFRCIAFDLPYHGKSFPPYAEQHSESYYLTGRFIMDFINAFASTLELEQPIYMGMSIGGYLAADLVLYYPENYRAVIGVGAALSSPAEYVEKETVRQNKESSDTISDDIKYNIAPSDSMKNINELLWINRTNVPEVFYGDQYYYNYDHHITPEQARTINTDKCMLYLLAGEYDKGTPPSFTQEFAELVEGSKFWKMKKLGHFPAMENYTEFRKYLLPILAEIVYE